MSCEISTAFEAASWAVAAAALAITAGALAYVAKVVDEWRRWRR